MCVVRSMFLLGPAVIASTLTYTSMTTTPFVPATRPIANDLPAPHIVAQWVDEGTVRFMRFSWKPVKNASGYDVRDFNCDLSGRKCRLVPDHRGRTIRHYKANVTFFDYKTPKTTGVRADVRATFRNGLVSKWSTKFVVVSAKRAPGETPGPAPGNPSAPGTLAAPTNLNATWVSDSAIRLTWKDNSNNESGFEPDGVTDGWGPFKFGDIILPANSTSYVFKRIPSSRTYVVLGVSAYIGDDPRQPYVRAEGKSVCLERQIPSAIRCQQ